jgi:hypothetical protein
MIRVKIVTNPRFLSAYDGLTGYVICFGEPYTLKTSRFTEMRTIVFFDEVSKKKLEKIDEISKKKLEKNEYFLPLQSDYAFIRNRDIKTIAKLYETMNNE